MDTHTHSPQKGNRSGGLGEPVNFYCALNEGLLTTVSQGAPSPSALGLSAEPVSGCTRRAFNTGWGDTLRISSFCFSKCELLFTPESQEPPLLGQTVSIKRKLPDKLDVVGSVLAEGGSEFRASL